MDEENNKDQELDKENNQEPTEKENNQAKKGQEAEDMGEAAKEGADLAKNVATQNYVGIAKNAVKLAANKTFRKKAAKHAILQIVLPFVILIIAGAIVTGLLEEIVDTIVDVLVGIADFFTIDIDVGSIKIEDEAVDTIINSIEELGVSAEDLYLLGDYGENATEEEKQEALRKYIRKFYEAQVVTETLNYYHKEPTDTETYGGVYVYRTNENDSDGTNRRNLTYIPYEEMQEKQKAGDSTAKDYFSIDNETGNLVVAVTNQSIIETGTSLDSLSEQSNTTTITLKTIDYKSAISQYTTQMNFFICLTMVSQNPEFASAVVDLIKDSKIDITIMDNTSTTVRTETYTYILNSKEEGPVRPIPSIPTQETEITRTTTINTNPSFEVTYAKTWFCEQSISYKKSTEGPTQTVNNTTTLADQVEPPSIGSWRTEQTKHVLEEVTTISYEEIPSEGATYILGQAGDGERYANGEIDEPTFVGLLETEFKIPNSSRTDVPGPMLDHNADVLFYLMQQDSKLQNMEKIMRYALYLYSGKDYGVTSLDGSLFEIRDFATVGLSGGSAIAEFIRSYENEALRVYMNGTSSDYSAVSDYVNQDKTQYRMYYTPRDGCLNFSYGIMVRNSLGDLNNVGYFADEGIDLQSLIDQYNSGTDVYVDVEIIDRIFLKIINDRKNSLKEILAEHGVSMEAHQIDALVSVSYQYGNCGQYYSGSNNIVELYKTYYQTGAIEEFRNNAHADDGEGGRLYFFVGDTDRKEYTWILFNEGRYILSNRTEIKNGSAVVDFALQFVGEGHSRFTSYSPTNGVANIWYGADWCAMFVSYCFNECGLIPDPLPRPYASCGLIQDLYNEGNPRVKIVGDKGVFAGVPKDDYIPGPGDIIFINPGDYSVSSHTGIVVDCDGTKVYTVEGNTGGSEWSNSIVSRDERNLDSADIVGYISVNG